MERPLSTLKADPPPGLQPEPWSSSAAEWSLCLGKVAYATQMAEDLEDRQQPALVSSLCFTDPNLCLLCGHSLLHPCISWSSAIFLLTLRGPLCEGTPLFTPFRPMLREPAMVAVTENVLERTWYRAHSSVPKT